MTCEGCVPDSVCHWLCQAEAEARNAALPTVRTWLRHLIRQASHAIRKENR